MQTATLKQRKQDNIGFEVISEDNNTIVFRKSLQHKPSKKYEAGLPTVTMHCFTEEQFIDLAEEAKAIYKKERELKALSDVTKPTLILVAFLLALKRFISE